MSEIHPMISPALGMLPPSVFLIAALIGSRLAPDRGKALARLNTSAAWLALVSAMLISAVFGFRLPASWIVLSTPLPGDLGAFSIHVYIDAITLIMLLLVSFVGVIVSRYAKTYLDGDPGQGRFHLWLMATLGAILTLIVSGNLLMFALAWIATSLCLHQLLTFYRERGAAVRAAHKKFIASRIGDTFLLLAVMLIGSTLHTLELSDLYARLSHTSSPLPASLQAAALLIVGSAALKSAQFPLHGWLIQVMEAPTPVSALLHAGIVNAGAFLVLRMSPLMSQSSAALVVLAMIGLITLAIASLVMLTQTSIKVSLAWSTTAQMGFMLLECGLGLYSLAMLHLVAHSLYKAHAFLASGSGVDSFRAPVISSVERSPAWQTGLTIGLAVIGTVAIGLAFRLDWKGEPALVAAGAIIALATVQLVLQASRVAGQGSLMRALVMSMLISASYFALHSLFGLLLTESVTSVQSSVRQAQIILVPIVILVFVALILMQEYLRAGSGLIRQALWVHLYNGMYIDVAITRVLQRVWPEPKRASEQTSSVITHGA